MILYKLYDISFHIMIYYATVYNDQHVFLTKQTCTSARPIGLSLCKVIYCCNDNINSRTFPISHH